MVSDRCARPSAEAGAGIDYQDLTRQEVEEEPTRTYLWRVLVVNTRSGAPTVHIESKIKRESSSRLSQV
jgi:hypothetical protein